MSAIDDLLADQHVREVREQALATPQSSVFYYKWTCGGCGKRAISDIPFMLNTSYRHVEEGCGYETRTVDGDLGFLLLI